MIKYQEHLQYVYGQEVVALSLASMTLTHTVQLHIDTTCHSFPGAHLQAVAVVYFRRWLRYTDSDLDGERSIAAALLDTHPGPMLHLQCLQFILCTAVS